MDALSEVLTTLRLSTTFFCRAEVTSPWGVSYSRMPVAMFHAVREGQCWLRVEGTNDEPIGLTAGDMVVLPLGDAHILADAPQRPARDVCELMKSHDGSGAPPLLAVGGGGASVVLLCGTFHLGQGDSVPLLACLPRVMIVRGSDGRARPWLEATLAIMSHESACARAGSRAVLERATDILFVQTIRTYLEQQDLSGRGWLRGMGDTQIASAMAAIHARPGHAWTASLLALEAGMSRSSFCERFRELVGEPPRRYLARWRMQVAAAALRNGSKQVKQLAERVGFSDDAAFGKAFKSHFGVTPGAYRQKALRTPKGSTVLPLRPNGDPLSDTTTP